MVSISHSNRISLVVWEARKQAVPVWLALSVSHAETGNRFSDNISWIVRDNLQDNLNISESRN